MSFSNMNAGFAVMALVANAMALTLVMGYVVTRVSPTGRARWRRLRDQLTPASLPLAWIVGVFCTCSSLYLQFGEHLNPCDLCWFQRIFMYPQAIVLGIAAFTHDLHMVKRYMIPLAGIGSVISLIHINLTPLMRWLDVSTFPGCTLTAACSAQPIKEFGFVTIPYMALSGFLSIIALLLFMGGDMPKPSASFSPANSPCPTPG